MADFEWAIGIHRLMLRTVGLWPRDSQESQQIAGPKLRRLCNLVVILFVLTIPQLISLMQVRGDMILMIDNLQYALPWLMTVAKVCIIWRKQEGCFRLTRNPVSDLHISLFMFHLTVLALLIDTIERDWTKAKIKDERDVMLRCARFTRVIAVCALFVIFVVLTTTIGIPYLELLITYVTKPNESKRSLPIETYYPHDISESPQFELTFLVQAFAISVACFSYSGIDNLLGLLVLHVCGQLENLNSRLICTGQYPNFHAILRYNVEDHIRLIRFIDTVDDIFHLMLLGLVFCFAVLFGLQGFLIVNILNQKSQLSVMQLVWLVVISGSFLSHMCLYCAVGEMLVTQSEKIHQATYKYAWYDIEPKVAKNLVIIMGRASKPLYITAGKMFPMTMSTFCNLLKTSASYISMLLACQD